MSNFYTILEALTIVTIGYGFRFRQLAGHKGFDPSLITYANPLSIYGFNGQRCAILLAALVRFSAPTVGRLLLFLIAVECLCQLLVLFLFNRWRTQPTTYYVFLFGVASLLIRSDRSSYIVAAGGLMLLAELSLHFWEKRKATIYNNWVCDEALKLNRLYLDELQLDQPDKHWVLRVATTEQIARPAIVRLAERLYFIWKRPTYISTGIMQVRAQRSLSDLESMTEGAKIIADLLTNMPKHLNGHQQIIWMAKNYNGSSSYAEYLLAVEPGVNKAWRQITKA